MRTSRRILVGLTVLGLVALQACVHDTSVDLAAIDKLAYDNADPVNGARLFDQFWETENYSGPVDPTIKQKDIEDYSNFYRCKQCHGWDLKARKGAYAGRAPQINRPNVSEFELWEPRQNDGIKELFDAIRNGSGAAVDPARTADGTNSSLGGDLMPAFGKILTDEQIWDLVKFIKEGAMDTEQFYDLGLSGAYPTAKITISNLGKDGDAAAGDSFYATNCASCHGNDGTAFLIDEGTLTLGKFARTAPYELQHKAKFGDPDGFIDGMVGVNDASIDDIKNLIKALSNLQKYPDTKADTGPISYASNVQPFFDASCILCHNETHVLNLLSGVSYNNLINGGYIDTANPGNSLLYTQITTGNMSQYAAPSEKQMILQWIQEGALNN